MWDKANQTGCIGVKIVGPPKALKKMFLNQEIDPDQYSGKGIYNSRNLLQQFEFNIFSKHLREMDEAIKSVGGVDHWSDEGK